MAPKKATGSKKQKTGSSASAPVDVPPNVEGRFVGPPQFAKFQELQLRKLWYEKEFPISPTGPHRSFIEAIQALGWGKLLEPEIYINDEVVREFYANAFPTDLTQPFPFITTVRGRPVRFDRDAINKFLGKPYTRESEEDMCDYAVTLAKGNWDAPGITELLLLPGHNLTYNDKGLPLRVKAENLTPVARLGLLFILHNVIPWSHISDATMPIVGFLYFLFKKTPVDVAQVIANELKEVVLSGVFDRTRANCLLPFPALIMGLIEKARIIVPANFRSKIGKIDDKHIERWCTPKTPIQTQPPASTQAPPQFTPPPHPQFSDQQLLYHIMDQNAANHRADAYLYQAMYQMSLNQPLYDPSQFYSHVAWPGDRPQFGEGAGASGAGASGAGANVGDDDDPIDERAADAFVSDEGDGDDDTMED
ncbi:unnamed protein product [Trifolium pratense]|uniref:Uncharacterized protein n=1 Tax=Trifolium pratense TaxID=57577 RepID=A0ACB0KWY7_TRIPR|nr:unnamed protein product [Trifolium pratense]